MIGPLVAMYACTGLGLYFTPAVAREVAAYWPVLLLAGAFAILLGACGGWILSRITGTDRTTAFFASVPGGATEMTVLGERFGARADRVALAQSLRIAVVVIVVPVALAYAGVRGAEDYRPVTRPVNWPGLVALLAIASAAGGVLQGLRMPNAFMFGPLSLVTVLSANGVEISALPGAASNVAQVLLGCALGARFERRSLQSAPRYVFGVLASVMTATAAAAVLAAGTARAAGLPLGTMVLAMAPGGIAEMCITAKVLQLGVALVTAAHVTRVLVLIATTSPSYRMMRMLRARFRGA